MLYRIAMLGQNYKWIFYVEEKEEATYPAILLISTTGIK